MWLLSLITQHVALLCGLKIGWTLLFVILGRHAAARQVVARAATLSGGPTRECGRPIVPIALF